MKKYLPLFIFLVIFLGLNIYKVVTDVRPFFDWDEGIYAQVGREMVQAKSYLIPLWQGKAWLDKPFIPPLLYGLMTYIPVQNEVSMRVLTILMSACALTLLYIFARRYSKSTPVALLTVILTSFLPAYLQRTQSLNVDVFLLIGWLGYVLWYKNLVLGTFFLTFGVLSKSLLGYFPVAMVFFYESAQMIIIGKKRKRQFILFVRNTIIQVGVSSLWFIGMYIRFGYEFIQYHIIDSHFKRVTASIEQHFGQRTFYIDQLFEILRLSLVPAFISLLFLGYTVIKKKSKDAFFSLIFVPWFLFLNLTKTKIAWYLYPVIPQFVYLCVYPLTFLKQKSVQGVFAGVLLVYFFTRIFSLDSYLTANFSTWEDHQLIAVEAQKARCQALYVLVNDSTRTSYATLKSMDLVIHTTTWWGNHPSMAYYSEVKTIFEYTLAAFKRDVDVSPVKTCFTAEKEDWNAKWGLQVLSKNKTFLLGVKE